jgi:hypothetical protein
MEKAQTGGSACPEYLTQLELKEVGNIEAYCHMMSVIAIIRNSRTIQ